MKLLYLIFFTTSVIFFSCNSRAELRKDRTRAPKITFKANPRENKLEVLVDGKLFTAYRWPENVYKPILYPLVTAAGTEITRGYPLNTRSGERADHTHQVGIWLNYGDVNNYDFWGNGSSGKRNIEGGQIMHLGIEQLNEGSGEGSLIATASWIDPEGKELLAERTEYHFIAKDSTRIIDRLSTLTATGGDVTMEDTKEGMFGIRVARQLELPSQSAVALTDAQGKPGTEKVVTNQGVTGNYRSSEGTTGEGVWGTRARWMNLYGSIGEEKISLTISDHPENLNYPTYWHARGYGLFAANPFGVKDFTKGAEELNYVIPDGQSITFRYRVILHSGTPLTDEEITQLSENFATKY
ncbi:MAG TPA: PmoA family protein [Cyclobacteriaceae bacterium]|nr:PmoA family protein [Cyclobacteriaceae bacterium]